MRVAVKVLEVPADAPVGATVKTSFPFDVQAIHAAYNGRSGGADAAGPASHRWGMGVWAPNAQQGMGSGSEDASDTSQAYTRRSTTAAVAVCSGTGANLGEGALSTSWDGVTCTVTLTVMASFAQPLSVVLTAVGGLTGGAEVRSLTMSNGAVTATGYPAPVDSLVLLHRNTVQAIAPVADSHCSFGVVARGPGDTIEQAAAFGASDHGRDTSQAYRYGRGGASVLAEGVTVGGGLAFEAAVTSWTSDGYTIEVNQGTPGSHIVALALMGCDARVLEGWTSDEAGSYPISGGPGFQAAGGLFLAHGSYAQDPGANMETGDVRMFGVLGDSGEQYALGAVDAHGAPTTQVGTLWRSNAVYARPMETDRSLGSVMRVQAVGQADVTLQMVTPEPDEPRWFAALLLGPADLPIPPPDAVGDVAAEPLRANRNKISSAADLAASGATTYDVQRSLTGTGSWAVRALGRPVLPGANEYEDQHAGGDPVYYRLKATGPGGSVFSNVAGPVTTVLPPTAVIDAPASGTAQAGGTAWAFAATTTEAESWHWSSSRDGELGTTKNLSGVTLSGTDESPLSHTITLRATNATGDEAVATVGVVSGISTSGDIIIEEEDAVFTREWGSSKPVPFTLLTETGERATGVAFVAGDVKISKDGAAPVPVTTLPLAVGSSYRWLPRPAEMSAALVEVLIAKAGYRPRTIYVETYGHPDALHEGGAEASGVALIAATKGARTLSLTIQQGALLDHAEIVFAGGARANLGDTGGGNPYPLLTPLTAPVLAGETWNLYGVPAADKEGYRLAGSVPTLEDLDVVGAGDVAQAVADAIGSAGLATSGDLSSMNDLSPEEMRAAVAAVVDERIPEVRAAKLDRDLAERSDLPEAPDNEGIAEIKAKTNHLPAQPASAGGAMTLTPEALAALESNVASALIAQGFTQRLARMLLRSSVWGGGGGSASRASAGQPLRLMLEGEDLGTVSLSVDSEGRLLSIASGE